MGGAALDDRTLRRVVAMLCALAVLADRAAGRSFPVRWLVLAILRPAETVARSFVGDLAPSYRPYVGEEYAILNSPAGAALLAYRLCMLAALLEALLPPATAWADWTGRINRRPCGIVPYPPAVTCGARAGWYDDSS